MRNLKKVLSLALALVMLLGMMVVGAGAATSFSDADKIKNTEAVDVVSGIGVLTGVGDGSFNPEGTLSRAEAAVVIAKLDLGAAFGNLETTNASTFSDVPAGYWGKPYIDYCAARGLIQGDGAGRFLPNDKVSGVQFALMVARVLGYEDKAEQVGGADWEVEAAALARKAGLTVDVQLGSLPMTRDDMAQVTYNALKANMVEYKNGTINIDVNGTPVTIGGNPATPKAATGKHYVDDVKQDNILQLCEEKFPQLTVRADVDDFDRPSNVWTYKREDIAVVPTTAMAEYHTTTKGTTIVSALKPDSKATVEYYEDGKQDTTIKTVANLKDKTSIGANGVLTQAWYNEDTDTLKVTLVNTYVGKVTAVKNGDTPTITVTPEVVTVERNAGSKLVKSFETTGFENGDVVAYTAAQNDDGKYDIVSVKALEVEQTGALTKWNGYNFADNSSVGKSNFYLDETKFEYSRNNIIEGADNNAIYDLKIKQNLNVYVDDFGYALYIAPVSTEINYAAVIGVGSTNAFGSATSGCTLLFPDGTIKEVTYKLSNNSNALSQNVNKNQTVTDKIADVVTYTVDDDNVYTLTLVKNSKAIFQGTAANGFASPNTTFVNGKSAMKLDGSDYYTTSKTVFFVATKSGDTYSYNAYTGYANMPSLDPDKGITGYAVTLNSKYTTQIDAVYISADELLGTQGVDTYFVKPAKDKAPTATDSTGTYYILNAIVKGEETTVMVRKDACTNFENMTGVFAATNIIKDKNDIITSFTLANDTTAFKASKDSGAVSVSTVAAVTGTVRDPSDRAVLGIGHNGNKDDAIFWAYGSDTKVYVVDKDYKTISISNMASVQDDINDEVFAGYDKDSKVLTDVIIVEKPVDDDSGANNATAPAGAYAAIIGADSNANLKVGYTGKKPANINELEAVVRDWAVNTAKYASITNRKAVSGGYTWDCLDEYGTATTVTLLTANVVEGFRVHYVSEDGTTTGKGWEIVADETASATQHAARLVKDGNTVTGLDVKNYTDAGAYIAVRAKGATTWNYSEKAATNAAFTSPTYDGEHKTITAHDSEILLSSATLKYKVLPAGKTEAQVDWTYAADGKLINGSGGVYASAAAFQADYPGSKIATKATGVAPVASDWGAPGSTLTLTDNQVVHTGYVSIPADAKGGSDNAVTLKVGGSDYTTVDGSGDFVVPINKSVEITIAYNAAVEYFRVNGGTTKVDITTNSTTPGTGTITTADEDITFAEGFEYTLADVTAGKHATVVYKANGKTVNTFTSTQKVALFSGDKVTVELTFDETGCTFSKAANAGTITVASDHAGNFTTGIKSGAPGADVMNSWTSSTGVMTIVTNKKLASTTITFELTVTAAATGKTISVAITEA